MTAVEPKRPYEIKAGKNWCHTWRWISEQLIAIHLFHLFQTRCGILSLILLSPFSILSLKILYHTMLQLWRTLIQITGVRAIRVRKNLLLELVSNKVLSNASLDYRATELLFLKLPSFVEGKVHTADSAQIDLARNLCTPAKRKRSWSSYSTQLLPV